MKAIYILCLFFLSVNAVINQEAQRREAPAFPQKEYGPPRQQVPVDQRNRRVQAMQRLIAAMRNGGYSAQSQGRVVNRPRPIPVQNSYGPPAPPPQNTYGPPTGHSSSSGSLAAFTHNHNPDVRCDGWIPIPGPSISSGSGSSSSGTIIDTSYGPPKHSNGGALSTLIVVPEDTSYSSGSSASSGSVASVDTSYGQPIAPQNTYGPPHSFSSGSSASSGSVSSIDTSYGQPIAPQNTYGPPHSFSSGSSASSGSLSSIDTSFGIPPPPANPQSSYGPPQSQSSGSSASSGSLSSIDTSYVQPVAPQNTYGPPHSFSSGSSASSGSLSSIDTSYVQPVAPQNTYGPPHSFSSGSSASSGSVSSIDTTYGRPVAPSVPQNTYGPPQSFSSGSSASSGSLSSIDTSFGIPPPPVNPQKTYGPPRQIQSGYSSSSSIGAIDNSYGVPPEPVRPQNTYGPPHISSGGSANSIHKPDNSYGPPIIVGSGHASSASAIASIDQTVENNYLPPQSVNSGHSSSGHSSSGSFGISNEVHGHQTYGPPQNPTDFGPPESSYGPPPSGAVEFKQSNAGHAGTIQTIPNLPTDLQLPISDNGAHFDSAIGLVSSTLGVSAGNSEVIKSHAIHESHTSEVASSHSNTQSFSSGSSDTYSAPPLDSYAPGKYSPSFLQRRPQVSVPRPIAPQPQRPQIAPQRPIAPQPRPQYIPPIPIKTSRPQLPPPNFRPLPQGGHAQSIAHGYSSQSHTQSIQQGPPRPIRPLIHRQPVPQGLIQSIGQNVQAQDAHRGISSGNTYLPPPTNEVPIPPMKLVLPNPGPVHQFQSHSQSGGVASSSSSFSLQNQELRHVHVIHDCGKGPQLSQSYGTPLAPPLTSYGSPNIGETHSAVLSAGYEVPSSGLEAPQHQSINFNSPANSYGPPASGPASLDVLGLESRSNAIITEPQPAESKDSPSAELPGLTGGLSSSGLDFISAIKSQSIEVPQNQGAIGNFQLHIQGSQSGQDNRIDGADHQQILADGLLQSILTAIEQKPSQTVPQVKEDAENDHNEAKTFLKSRQGQEVLGDKSNIDAKSN